MEKEEDFDWDKLFVLLKHRRRRAPKCHQVWDANLFRWCEKISHTGYFLLSASTTIYSPFSLLAPYSEPHHQNLIGHSPGVVERALSIKIQTHLASSTKEEEEALIYFYRENGRHKHSSFVSTELLNAIVPSQSSC